MIATNHALTGAVIGLAVGNPLVAVPAALLSHYVCDALPHFGLGPDFIKTKAFRNYLIVDAVVCVLLVLALFATQPTHWLLASVCAFVAAMPDFAMVNRYYHVVTNKPYVSGLYNRFAGGIQWFERPIGGFVELAWAFAATYTIFVLTRA